MLDRLINFEIKFLFFSNDTANVLMTVIGTAFLMFSLYQLPDKEWLILIVGLFIVRERVLLLKIRRMQSSVGPGA